MNPKPQIKPKKK